MNIGGLMILAGMLMMVLPLLNPPQLGSTFFGISNALRKVYRPPEETPEDMIETLERIPEAPPHR